MAEMQTVVGTAPTGSMAAATGEVIRDIVEIETSRYGLGVVIRVPGLSYYSSVTAAAEAVRLLHLGQYPVVHGPIRRDGDL